MDTKHIKALAKIANNATHPNLKVLKFSNSKVVATDSFRLVEMKCDAPDAVIDSTALGLIPAKTPVSAISTMITGRADDTFPKYDEIFPTDFAAEIKINAGDLAEVLSALKGLNDNDSVTLKIPTATGKPLTILAGDKARALVMPLNR